MRRTVLRNVIANWSGFVVQVVTTFILAPFVIRHLGEVRFGVWTLVHGIVGYYGVLDIGFRAGVTQHLTRYLAQQRTDRVNEVMSGSVRILRRIGAGVIVVSLSVGLLAPYLFTVPVGYSDEIFWCIVIFGVSAGVEFSIAPYSALFAATERYDLSNIIGISTRVASAVLIYVALENGYGLVAISLVTGLCNLAGYLMRWYVARSLVPNLHVTASHANATRNREIWRFGGWNFLISLGNSILRFSDPIVIAFMMKMEFVGAYHLAGGLIISLASMLGSVRMVFYPALARLHVQHNQRELYALYLSGSKLLLLATVFCSAIGWCWADEFYRLWIGDEPVTRLSAVSIPTLFRLLLVANLFTQMSGLGTQLLLGVARLKLLSIVVFAEALANIVLSVLLIQRFDLLGVVMGTAISAFVIRVIVIPTVVSRELGQPLWQYWTQCVWRPLVVLAIICGSNYAIRAHGTPRDWTQLFAYGLVAGLVGSVVVLMFGLTADERNRIVCAVGGRLAKELRRTRGWNA